MQIGINISSCQGILSSLQTSIPRGVHGVHVSDNDTRDVAQEQAGPRSQSPCSANVSVPAVPTGPCFTSKKLLFFLIISWSNDPAGLWWQCPPYPSMSRGSGLPPASDLPTKVWPSHHRLPCLPRPHSSSSPLTSLPAALVKQSVFLILVCWRIFIPSSLSHVLAPACGCGEGEGKAVCLAVLDDVSYAAIV